MKIRPMKMEAPTVKKCLEVGILLGLILLIIGYVYDNDSWYPYSGICLFISLLWPKFWNPVAVVWFSIGEILGKVISYILLTVLFLCLVTPVGLIRRAMGKDSLNLKGFKKDTSSHFVPVNKIIAPEDMTYQF